MKTFKPGDRVTILADATKNGVPDYYLGKEGVVVAVSVDHRFYTITIRVGTVPVTFYLYEHELQLVE